MGSPELRGVYVDSQGSSEAVNENRGTRNPLLSSGINSPTESITSNNNSVNMARKRNVTDGQFDAGQYESQLDDYEMEKIRRLMAHVDGDRRSSGTIGNSHRGSIDSSLMSTVFAVVLVIVISISVYAFTSLFWAVMKRING